MGSIGEGGGRGRSTVATMAAARFGCNIVVGEGMWPAYWRRRASFLSEGRRVQSSPQHIDVGNIQQSNRKSRRDGDVDGDGNDGNDNDNNGNDGGGIEGNGGDDDDDDYYDDEDDG